MSIFSWFKPKRDKAGKEGKDVAVKIIVGLGNPGPRYEMTRHNVGFRVIHALGTSYGGEFKIEKKFQAEICKVPIEGQDVVLVKPMTMMNLSGHAFVAVKNWYKVPLENFLVVHDDVSIALGRLRLQRQGGAGGQHGVESIIEQLGGDKGFDRLKFGVGPDPGGALRADYVLGAFPVAQEDLLEKSLEAAGKAVKSWLNDGIQVAMNAFNGVDLVG